MYKEALLEQTLAFRQLEAAHNVSCEECRVHYAALNPPALVLVQPLVISSFGYIHKVFYLVLLATVPETHIRLRLLTDVSIALIRAHPKSYILPTGGLL
jgi:hypothetical protein